MKNTFTLLLATVLSLSALAQRNFQRFSLGIGGGISRNSANLASADSRRLLTGSFDYFINPYVQIGLELQSGKMYGESSLNFYQNNFNSLLMIGKIHAGQFMRRRSVPVGSKALVWNTAKGIYGGAGIGAISSNQRNVLKNDLSSFNTSRNSIDAVVPIVLGIDNSGFNSRLITGFAYQGHLLLNDQINSYDASGKNKAYYSTFVVSFKVRLGPLGIY